MRSHEGRPAAGLLGAQQRRGGEGEGEVRRGEVVAAVQPRVVLQKNPSESS